MAVLIRIVDGKAQQPYELNKPAMGLGRATDNDIVVNDQAASSHHAVVEQLTSSSGIEFHILDLGSTNQTLVNGKPVSRQRLHDLDMVRIGLSFFEFRDENEKGFDKTRKLHKSWVPGLYYTKD